MIPNGKTDLSQIIKIASLQCSDQAKLTSFFINLYKYAKNEVISLIYSKCIADLRILQSNWERVFWPILQEQDFFQYKICAST